MNTHCVTVTVRQLQVLSASNTLDNYMFRRFDNYFHKYIYIIYIHNDMNEMDTRVLHRR